MPQEVLHAISLTETGRPDGGRLRPWPWAINREGQGHWFGNRAEAFAFAQASLAAGRGSFDVGCFQINYHWHGHNFPSLEAMFDPEAGATYAARFLQSLYLERGSWLAAAGAYHSQTPSRASVYRARFERILAGLGGNTDLAVADGHARRPAAEAGAAAQEPHPPVARPEDHHRPVEVRPAARPAAPPRRADPAASRRHRRPHALSRPVKLSGRRQRRAHRLLTARR